MTPIAVRRRRRKRFYHRIWFWLLLLGAGLSIAFALRVGFMNYPLAPTPEVEARGGWRVLRGLFHQTVSGPDPAEDLRLLATHAFHQGLDFLVVAAPEPARLQEMAQGAPLAVLVGQAVLTSRGRILMLGTERVLAAEELQGAGLFGRVREAGGMSVVLHPADPQEPWTGWELSDCEGIEVLSAQRLRAQAPFWFDGLQSWLGRLFHAAASESLLAVRPVSELARWDDLNRHGRVQIWCGLDSPDLPVWRSLYTYVLVPDGLGPYGPDEVLRGLRAGRHFCAVPALWEPVGFRFWAEAGGHRLAEMGEARPMPPGGVELVADLGLGDLQLPGVGMRLLQDGVEVAVSGTGQLRYHAEQAGAYRVEAFGDAQVLPLGLSRRTFLYGNPIFMLEVAAPAEPAGAVRKSASRPPSR